jgi:hypothetical protein
MSMPKQKCSRVFCLLAFLTLPTALMSQTIDVWMPDTTAVAGQVIGMPIYVGDISGLGVTAYEVVVKRDTAVLAYQGATRSELNAKFGSFYYDNSNYLSDIEPHRLKVTAAGTSPVNGSGLFIVLNFLVKDVPAGTRTDIEIQKFSLQYPPSKAAALSKVMEDVPVSIQSGSITVTSVVPPGPLNAVDTPGDGGGFIDLHFIASPHHPSASGTLDDALSLTGYQVYSADEDSLALAKPDTLVLVDSLTVGEADSVRLTIQADPEQHGSYYWVSAVIDSGESELVGSNFAHPINNMWSEYGDLDGNQEVDIWDVAVIAQIFGIAAEYDPAIDLNGNGEIDIWDVAIIAKYFARVFQ